MRKRSKAKQEKIDKKLKRAKMIKKSKEDLGFNIAAFDQATKCGLAYQISGEEYKYELWDLTLKSKQSQGFKWLRFETKVIDFIKKNDIRVIAYELPSGRHTNPIIHSSKLICVLEKVCASLEIDYIEFSSKEVKSFATNNGNANKEMMIEYARNLWGYLGDDDNEADAIHILHLLKTKF